MTTRSLQLTQRQTRILADMGIDVWHLRSDDAESPAQQGPSATALGSGEANGLASLKSALSETPLTGQPSVPEPALVLEARPKDASIPAIRLYHLHNECALLLSAEPLSTELRHIAADLLLSQRWRRGSADNAKPELSEFNWPLTGAVGTPERALLAFMDKFGIGAQDGRIVFCSAATHALIAAWVPLTEHSYLLIPELSELMVSADAKRHLWQMLSTRK